MANDGQASFNFRQVMRGYDKEEVETYIKDLNNSKNVSLKMYEQKVDELKEKLVLSNRERDALREKYASAKAEVDPIRQELNEAKAELAETKLALEKAQSSPGVMGAATYTNFSATDDATFKSRINELTATVSQLSADLQIKEEKLEEITKAVDLKDARIRDLEKQIEDLTEKTNLYDDLYARNAALLREHEALVDRFNSLSASYQLTLDKRSTMEKQYQEAIDKYNLLSAEYESALKDNTLLDKSYKETLQKYNDLCEEHNDFQKATEQLRRDAEHYAEIDAEINRLRADAQEYESSYSKLQQEKDELASELETKTNMVTTLANETEFHKQYASELEEEVICLEVMVNEYVTSCAAAQSDEFLEKYSAQKDKTNENSAVINKLNKTKNALEAEYIEKINQMEKDFAVTKSDLEEQLKQRDLRISEIDALIDMFVEQINELNAKRDSAAASVARETENEPETEAEFDNDADDGSGE